MENELSHLPPGAQQLVRILGLEPTLRMVDKFGGMTVRLYPTGESVERMARSVGGEATDKLLAHFGSDPFFVPKCRSALNDVRNARIHAEYDRLTQQQGLSGLESVQRLVEMFGITDRQVWRILKQPTGRRQARVDERQMSLLDS